MPASASSGARPAYPVAWGAPAAAGAEVLKDRIDVNSNSNSNTEKWRRLQYASREGNAARDCIRFRPVDDFV